MDMEVQQEVAPLVADFEGYVRDKFRRNLPPEAGLFCVYTSLLKKKEAAPLKLIFIGAADDLQAEVAQHELAGAWEDHLDTGEELCYSYARVADPQVRAQLLAALVARHHPPENRDRAFPYPETTVVVGGKHSFLAARFTLKP